MITIQDETYIVKIGGVSHYDPYRMYTRESLPISVSRVDGQAIVSIGIGFGNDITTFHTNATSFDVDLHDIAMTLDVYTTYVLHVGTVEARLRMVKGIRLSSAPLIIDKSNMQYLGILRPVELIMPPNRMVVSDSILSNLSVAIGDFGNPSAVRNCAVSGGMFITTGKEVWYRYGSAPIRKTRLVDACDAWGHNCVPMIVSWFSPYGFNGAVLKNTMLWNNKAVTYDVTSTNASVGAFRNYDEKRITTTYTIEQNDLTAQDLSFYSTILASENIAITMDNGEEVSCAIVDKSVKIPLEGARDGKITVKLQAYSDSI